MELLELLEVLRVTYAVEFEIGLMREASQHEEVFPEVALEISGTTYKRLYIVDFLVRDGAANIVMEVAPREIAYGGSEDFTYKSMSVDFGNVSWDAMKFEFFPEFVDPQLFEQWFDRWLDFEGVHHSEGSRLSETIHSATLGDGTVEVDFGTAPSEAAVELLDVFADSGVRTLTIETSREKVTVEE